MAVAGVELPASAFACDATTGLVTLAKGPRRERSQVTAGFAFEVPVRFDTDDLTVDLAAFTAGEIPKVPHSWRSCRENLPAAFAAHVAGGVTTLCRCWSLRRRDGTALGFTDHDRDLTLAGLVHAALYGARGAEASDGTAGFAVSAATLRGRSLLA